MIPGGIFGGFGSGGSGGALSFFSGDLATRPWSAVSTGPSHIHSGGKTYSAYIADTPPQTAKITVYDHATETEETYVIDSSPLRNDDHGLVALCLLSDGRLVAFYGSHNSDQEWSISGASGGNPDPSTWTRQTAISGEMTYPKPVNIPDGSGGGTLYLFTREDETDRQLKVRTAAYTSGGAVSFGSPTALVDLNGRIYAAEVRATDATSSADIEFMAAAADSGDTVRRHVYYFKYITATGAVENLGGGTSTASGSLPINKTLADSDYREVDTGTNDSGIPSWCRDANGDLHVLYGDDSTSAGQAHDIKHNIHSGGSWGTATTPFTVINVSGGAYPNHFCLVPGDTGDEVEAWYPAGNTGSFSAIGGDSMARKVHESGSWGSEETIHTGTNSRALAAPTSVLNGHADFRVAFAEVTQGIQETDSEALERYGHGDSGFVQWPTLTDANLYRNCLLLGFNGSDGATATDDESHWSHLHPVTFNGDAQLDTAQSKFGGSSLLLDGSGDYLTIPRSRSSPGFAGSEFRLRPDDTIEFFLRPNETGRTQYILTTRPAPATADGFSFVLMNTNVLRILGWDGSSLTTDLSTTTTLSAGTWYYVALRNNAGTIELWLDGTMENSGGATPSEGEGLTIGRNPNSAGSELNAWLDELRWTKDGLRGVSSVPAAAFPRT